MKFCFPAIAILLSAYFISPVYSAEGQEKSMNGEDFIPVELTGLAKAGYSSRYHYRGMVLADSGSGGMTFDTELAFQPKVPMSPFVAFSYRDMEVFNSNGQTNFVAGFQHSNSHESGTDNEAHSIAMWRFGYQLTSGGLPGVMKGWEKNRNLNSSSGTTQEIVANSTTIIPNEWGTTFTTLSGGYSFYGLTGWHLSVGLGHLYPVNDWLSVALSGNISWSFNYWTSAHGSDQANILLTFPIKAKEDCEVTPFIMADWGARNAKLINSRTGTKVIENFAIVAGVSFTLNF